MTPLPPSSLPLHVVTYQIKTGGELTTITKMARKAPKCLLGLDGVPPPHDYAIQNFTAHAWSYDQHTCNC